MKRALHALAALGNGVAAGLGVGVIAVVAGLLFLDPAEYRGQLIDLVQDATGRRLTVGGELRVGKSLWPTLEANDVSLANLPGGSRPAMAHAERIEARLSLPALLRGTVDITRLSLTGPNILFETVAGRPNWVFAAAGPDPVPAGQTDGDPGFGLRVQVADIRNGMITWRLPARTKVVGIRALHFERKREGGPVRAQSTLVYGDNQPFRLDVEATPTAPGAGASDPWQTRLHFEAFDTVATAEGQVALAGPYELQVEAKAGAVERLNALLPEMGLPPLHGATLSAHIANGARPGDLPVLGPARLRFDSADLRGSVPGLQLGTTAATLPAAGGRATIESAGRYGATPLRLQAAVAIPTHPDGKVTLPVSGTVTVTGSDGSAGIDGQLTLDTLRFAGLDGAVTARAAALAALRPVFGAGLPALEDVRFTGRVSVPAEVGGAVRLRGVKLETAQGDLAGEGSVDPGQPVALSGSWRSERIDLDRLLAAFGVDLSGTASGGSGPVIPDTPLPWDALGAARLELKLAAGTVQVGGEPWRDVQAAVTLKEGRLQAGPISAALPQGGSRAELSMVAGGGAVSASMLVPALPMGWVARLAGVPGPVAVAARVEARWQGRGNTVRALAGSLAGPFSVAAVGGQLSNRALLAVAGPALEALGIAVPAAGETQLDCLGLAGSFAAGVGTFRTVALQSTYLSLEGTGQVDLRREALLFQLQPMAQVAGSSVSVPVVVEGPFRAVSGRLDAGGLQQLGFLLDGLFGGDRARVCQAAGLVK